MDVFLALADTDMRPIDLWDAWLFAEAEASLMLYAWLAAPTAEKASRHTGYRAALDREEHAARVLAEQPAAPRGPSRPLTLLSPDPNRRGQS